MTKKRKKTKLEKFTPDETSVQQARFQSLRDNHERLSMILRDNEKWIRMAETINPKVNRTKLLERIVTRRRALATEIKKLRKGVPPVSMRPRQFPGSSPCPPPPFPGMPPDWCIPKDEKLPILDPGPPWPHIYPGRPIPVPIPPCEAKSGTIPYEDAGFIEFLEPQLSSTDVYHTFRILDHPSWAGPSVGLDFSEFFVEDDSDIDQEDGFWVMGWLRFDLPPPHILLPCDGELSLRFDLSIGFDPVFTANWGIITVAWWTMFATNLHPKDPNVLSSWDLHDYWTIQYRAGLPMPYPPPVYGRGYNSWQHHHVREKEWPYLFIGVSIYMMAEGGQAAINWGHLLVGQVQNSIVPGVVYHFTPT